MQGMTSISLRVRVDEGEKLLEDAAVVIRSLISQVPEFCSASRLKICTNAFGLGRGRARKSRGFAEVERRVSRSMRRIQKGPIHHL